ncbi:MAG TPA: PA-phosphatase, partial [Gammaproteobacteria bacterium]|nr:PA-phosphatase [Gammaproteobacteria bacterium]
MKQNPRSDWLQQVASRIKSHWLLKGIGTTGAITAFMVAYFTLLRHPQFSVTMIPPTTLDRLIAFQPAAIVPYASLWLYISLVPALLLRRECAAYLGAASVLGVVGLGIFLLWPTAVPQPDINWSLYPSVSFLKSLDAAGNACPSM